MALKSLADTYLAVQERYLCKCASQFGRLIYLANLYNPATGRYEHAGFSEEFGAQNVQSALRAAHQNVFQNWMGSDLKHQEADVRSYLMTQDREPLQALGAMSAKDAQARLIPVPARDPEARLFLVELETTFAVMRAQLTVKAGAGTRQKDKVAHPGVRIAIV